MIDRPAHVAAGPVVRTYQGEVVEAWAFSDVQLDPALAVSDFTVQLAEQRRAGHRRPTRVSTASPLPEGERGGPGPSLRPRDAARRLRALAGRRRRPRSPLSRSLCAGSDSTVASLVYRRGFRSIVVTTRSSGGAALDAADDPFVRASTAGASGATRVVLRVRWTDGRARLVSARARCSCLTFGWQQDGLLVTVAGDVTRRELLQIAGSLESVRRVAHATGLHGLCDGHSRPTTSAR